MVTVLRAPQKAPSALESFSGGLGSGISEAFDRRIKKREAEEERGRQNKLIEEENIAAGLPAGLRSENLRGAYLKQLLEDESQRKLLESIGLGPVTGQPSNAQSSLLGEETRPGISQRPSQERPNAGLSSISTQKGILGEEPTDTTQRPFTSPLANLSEEQLLGLSFTKKGQPIAKQAQSAKEFKQKQDIAEAKSEREERKFKQTQDIAERDYNLKVHGLSEDYAKKLREKADIANNRLGIIEKSKQALKKTKTGALTLQNFFKTAYKDTPFENIALSPEGAIIEASIPTLLEGNKDIYGVRLSDRDLAVSLGKTISLGKSNDVNMAILEFNEDMDRLRVNKQKIADQILKENNGLRPLNFEGLVDQRFDQEYGNEIEHSLAKAMKDSGSGLILMRAPDGRLLNVPQEKVEEFKALKAKVL